MAVLTKTVAEYLADSGIWPYSGGDDVTISDTGAAIAGLTAAEIDDLVTNGVDTIDASDDLIILAGDQAIALAGIAVAIDADDFLILSDTGGNLAGISSSDFASIAAKGFGIVTSSGGSVSYTVAQYVAITDGGMAIDGANTVTLADTGGNVAALTAVQIAALASNGVDVIDTTGGLSLTAAQYLALGTVTLTGADVVTLADTGANIAALTTGQIGDLDAAGFDIDAINASDNVLALTVAQYNALGTVALTGADAVSLTDTGANLAALSTADIGNLVDIDSINASDNAITLTLAKLDAYDTATIALTGADTVTGGDTQANIEVLVAGDFTTYIAQGVDVFDSTDNNALNLTAAQAAAVALSGLGKFVSADTVIVDDDSANIAALTSTQIAAMATALVDTLDASDTDLLTFTAAQAGAINGMHFNAANAVSIVDTGANIATLSAADVTDLANSGALSVEIKSSTNAFTFTAAKAAALGGIAIEGNDVVSIIDTGANIGTLVAADLADLIAATASSVTINASDDAFTWIAATAAGLGAIAIDASDAVLISDTGANIATLTSGDLDDLDTAAATVTINASDDAYTLNSAAKAGAIDGIVLASGDTVTVTDADIGSISSGDITTLAAQAAAIIFDDTTGNAYTLTETQAAEVGDISLVSGDAVLVSDATMGGLTSTQIDNLADKDATVTFDEVAGDDAYSLDAAEAAALGDIALAVSDTVTIADTAANLAGLSASDLANLASKAAAVVLDSSSNVLNLTVAQASALGSGLTLTGADIVSILDTGANIAAMSAGTISGLAAVGIDIINASDNALNFTVDQFNALGSVNLNNGDTVTLVDTGTNLAGLSAANIGALAGAGVDAINSSTNAITFTAAQAAALGAVDVSATDTITVSDTGANIAGITSAQIAILDGLSATVLINASDDAVTITAAQASAIGAITWHSSDTITISDTDANISAMSASDFSELAALAATVLINASDDAFTLTAAKAAVLGDITVDASDVITIADTGANIAGLTSGQITTLAAIVTGGSAVDIDASDNVLSLTKAQYLALGGITLAGADVVTLADTGANIAALTAGQIDDLDDAGYDFDAIDASDNALSLTVAQYNALGTVVLTGGDTVTLADTGANLAALTTVDIGNLVDVDAINATDNVLSLTQAQLDAYTAASITLTGADVVTFGDTQGNIQALVAGDFTTYITQGVDVFDSTDNNTLNLTAAQINAVTAGSKTFAAGDTVTLADTGANIGAVSAANIALLAGANVDEMNASDDTIAWDAAKASALGAVGIAANDAVTVSDTGANIGAMSATDLADLVSATASSVTLNASDNAITWTAAKAAAVGTIAVDATDAITLVDTGANLSALTSGQLTILAGLAATVVINASDNVLSLTKAKFDTLGSGLSITAGDVVTIADTGANIALMTISGLAAANVDVLNASDNVLTLTKAQYDALSTVTLTGADVVTLTMTGAQFTALTTGAITALETAGIDIINLTDDAATISTAQFAALGNMIFHASDAITVTGLATAVADTIAGSAGGDTFDGLAGNDSISGDDGDDTLDGGAGNDTIDGGNGGDDIGGGDGNDSVDGGNDEDSIDGGLGKDTLNGDDENDTINGEEGDDSITGGSEDDDLNGDAGKDKLFGQADDDTLAGGVGNDTLVGGDDADELNGGDGNDKLYGGDSLGGGADTNDELNGDAGNDLLFGEAGTDALNGGAGSDKLDGGAGVDTLNGGLGKDSMTGGTGDDVFIFDTATASNIDKLLDFSQAGGNGNDSIRLDNDIFIALGGAGALGAANFVNGTAAVDGNDYIIYDQASGKLWYDADGSVATVAKVQIALVSTKVAMTNADFTIID